MSDQADRLRQLVVASRGGTAAAALSPAEEEPPERAPGAPRGARSLLFTSGKGGVGTSNLVLNLAIALGELGQDVLVIDADIGLANLDLLCGLAPRYDLGDVLAGRCGLGEAVMTGPGGIRIVPGRACDPDRRGDAGGRRRSAGGRAGRAGVGVGLRAGGRGLGPGPGRDQAGGGGRLGGDRHARRSRRRWPTPTPRSAGSGGCRPRRGCAWWSTRPGRPRRRPRSSTGWSPPAGSSWAWWSRRWGRARCVPTPTSAWPSAPAGRS